MQRHPVRIALIGAGQIGSRHLQALALMDRPTDVFVFDPFEPSLSTAMERFHQVAGTGHVTVAPHATLSGLPTELDAVVVATSADVRYEALERLLHGRTIRYALLEKVLFQRPDDYRLAGALLEERGVAAFVNCARRMWPGYQELAAAGSTPLECRVSGSRWGLACNGIHFVDLFQLLTGTVPERYAIDALDPGTLPSKRAGFVELSGTLEGRTALGSLTLTSHVEEGTPLEVRLSCPAFQATIREGEQKLWLTRPDGEDATPQERPFPVLYQSQLTHLALSALLDGGTCPLPTYAQSRAAHLPFQRAVNLHLGREESDRCPIT